MNAFQKAKLERSLTLLKYMRSLADEIREYCKKHRNEVFTKCTEDVVQRLANGHLLYVVEQRHANGTEEYDAAPFDDLLKGLISSLENELQVMG